MAEWGEETGLEGYGNLSRYRGGTRTHIRKPGGGIHLHASRVPIL